MYYYTYAYLREDRTPYYIGKGEKDRIYKKGKKEIKPPKDKSRIIFLKQNLTEQEAFKHEIYMIAVFGRKDLGTGILRNKTNGGEGGGNWGTPKQRSEVAKNRARKLQEEQKGIFGLTKEQKRELGLRNYSISIGAIPAEKRREISIIAGKKSGKKAHQNKTGIHAFTKEQRSLIGKKNCKEKIGCFSISPEERSKIGYKSGKKAHQNKTGIHAFTKEQKSELAKRNYRNGKGISSITPEQRKQINLELNSKRWQCTETGFISNAGALSGYQKKRGIDTTKRIKLPYVPHVEHP